MVVDVVAAGFGARFTADDVGAACTPGACAEAVGATLAAGVASVGGGAAVSATDAGGATGTTFAGVAAAARSGGTRPSHPGFRQMMTAIPHAVTRTSIAMNATSFCAALGPRGRTTTVIARGRRGRSGMRIVGCATPRCTGNGGGVYGDGIGVTGASEPGPELGMPGADAGGTLLGGPTGTAPIGMCGIAIDGASGTVMLTGGADGTVSSTVTMTAGTSGSTGVCAGGTLCGRDDA